ncbi:hypothetical protein LX36DRAFT_662763 [Colletotrichum falcatum]|nr:hypothetical protein LX36DRAFT_662763 [Colletotrichum falcatum]
MWLPIILFVAFVVGSGFLVLRGGTSGEKKQIRVVRRPERWTSRYVGVVGESSSIFYESRDLDTSYAASLGFESRRVMSREMGPSISLYLYTGSASSISSRKQMPLSQV